jgi:hypothetical protein
MNVLGIKKKMTSTIQELKDLVYLKCVCGIVYKMSCFNEWYICRKCFQTINTDEFVINKKGLEEYIASHPTPKKALKMFIIKILNLEYDEEQMFSLDIHSYLLNGGEIMNLLESLTTEEN